MIRALVLCVVLCVVLVAGAQGQAVLVNSTSPECHHSGPTLTCHATAASQILELKETPDGVQKVFLYNAREVVLWPGVCTNLSLTNISQLSLKEGEGEGGCKGRGVWLQHSNASLLPPEISRVYADEAHIQELRLTELSEPMTILNSVIKRLEVDNEIVGHKCRIYNSRVDELRLRLGNGSELLVQSTKLATMSGVVAEAGSEIVFQGEEYVEKDHTSPMTLFPGASISVRNFKDKVDFVIKSIEFQNPSSETKIIIASFVAIVSSITAFLLGWICNNWHRNKTQKQNTIPELQKCDRKKKSKENVYEEVKQESNEETQDDIEAQSESLTQYNAEGDEGIYGKLKGTAENIVEGTVSKVIDLIIG